MNLIVKSGCTETLPGDPGFEVVLGCDTVEPGICDQPWPDISYSPDAIAWANAVSGFTGFGETVGDDELHISSPTPGIYIYSAAYSPSDTTAVQIGPIDDGDGGTIYQLQVGASLYLKSDEFPECPFGTYALESADQEAFGFPASVFPVACCPSPLTVYRTLPAGTEYHSTEQSYTADCAEGMTGDSVTFTVPAGMLVSFVSQEDADAKALAIAQCAAEALLECEPESPVNPLLTERLMLYYKFDDLYTIDGGELGGYLGTADALGNVNLSTINSSGDPVLVNDGIISNGLNFPSAHINIGINSFSPTQFTGEQKLIFDCFEQNFTIRFWIRLLESSTGTSDKIILLHNSGGPGSQWEIALTNPNNNVQFTVFEVEAFSNEGIPTDDNWHRVIIYRDYTNSLIGIKIDNNPTMTTAYIPPDISGIIDYFFIGNLNYAFDVDEFAFWKNYILTEDDMTYDWNSGSAKTYPFT